MTTEFIRRAEAAASIAQTHAEAVDRSARYPIKAFEELRRQHLLGMLIPTLANAEASVLMSQPPLSPSL